MKTLEYLVCRHLGKILIAATVFFSFGAVYGMFLASRASCENYAELTGEPHVYRFNGGCRIKRDGRWISLQAAEGGARDLTIREGK